MKKKLKERSSRRKKVLIALSSLLTLIVLTAGGYAFYLYHSTTKAIEKTYSPIKKSDKRETEIALDERQPFSILLIGVDERKNDKGRADSLIVVTVNPHKKSMYMFNIPRDTRTEIIGKGVEDKINHSYAFGGVEMTVRTVEHFLDIPIDYYIQVNMEALSKIVDVLGGITVYNHLEWADTGYYKKGFVYQRGELHLNGPQTLGYVRMRYQDPRGDLGRNERQRQVIQAIIAQGSHPATLIKLTNLLEILGNHIKTNLTLDNIKTIQKNYQSAREHIETFEIKGKGTKIDGIYYYIVTDEERKNISNKIKDHLAIPH
ncbi:MAG: LCP family protein [Anoxybacillus sp.]|nr:LCP family protein [Anoxybacillus sp.]MCL6584928.1 LCP family protein [Anoxybacillus sp.]